MLVGGAGYVGSVLIPVLLRENYKVVLVDNFYYGKENIKKYEGKIKIIEKDMRKLNREDMDGVNYLINLGGLSNDSTANYNPKANEILNTVCAFELAKLAKETNVSRYILASSCSVYDQEVLSSNDVDSLLNEESEIIPFGPYAESKFNAEEMIQPLRDENFTPIFLRKGTIHGFSERMRFDLVVNTMVKDALTSGEINLFSGGEAWRPLIEIRDVAEAYLLALKKDISEKNIFNVASKNYRISEVGLRVVNALRELGINCKINMRYDQAASRNYRVSNQKAISELGFKPKYTIEDSVREIIQNYRHESITVLEHPRHYNIRWIETLNESNLIINKKPIQL